MRIAAFLRFVGQDVESTVRSNCVLNVRAVPQSSRKSGGGVAYNYLHCVLPENRDLRCMTAQSHSRPRRRRAVDGGSSAAGDVSLATALAVQPSCQQWSPVAKQVALLRQRVDSGRGNSDGLGNIRLVQSAENSLVSARLFRVMAGSETADLWQARSLIRVEGGPCRSFRETGMAAWLNWGESGPRSPRAHTCTYVHTPSIYTHPATDQGSCMSCACFGEMHRWLGRMARAIRDQAVKRH